MRENSEIKNIHQEERGGQIPPELPHNERFIESNIKSKEENNKVGKILKRVFIILIIIFGVIVLFPPLFLFLACLLIGLFSQINQIFLHAFFSLYSFGIITFSIKSLKKKKKKIYPVLPYFIGLFFFGLLYLGGVIHQESNICSLVSNTNFLIKPILAYSGVIFSGIAIVIKTKKLTN